MLAALALAAALSGQAAAATPPASPTLVGAWRSLCASNRDDFAGALSDARAAGWMIAPDAIVAKVASPTLGKPQVMLQSSQTGMRVLFVGVSNSFPAGRGGAQLHVRYCGVGGLPPEASVDDDVKAFAAVPPNTAFSGGGGMAAYVYRDGPHRREALLAKPDDAETKKLLAEGRLNMVFAKGNDGSMSMVLFAVPTL